MRIITWPTAVTDENKLIQQFVTYPGVVVHIRKPTMNLLDTEQFIAHFTMAQRKQLVLHQHQQHSQQWGLERIHHPALQRAVLGSGPITPQGQLSTSTHSWAEFNALSPHYHAAFISPIFPSISKVGYSSREILVCTEKRSNYRTGLIALGGITPTNISSLGQQYDDFAACGGIWLSDDPLQAFQDYYYAWHTKKACNRL